MPMNKDEQWLMDTCNTPSPEPYLRPFAPNPNWYKASVFVVGTNPATPLRDEFHSFDNYWRALTQDVEEFQRVYSLKHKQGQSKTTKRISILRKYLSPLNVLVTNVYSYPASKPKRTPGRKEQEYIGEKIFRELLTICRPQAIFFHGSCAVEFARRYFNVDIDPYTKPLDQSISVALSDTGTPTWLYSYVHMSGLGVRKGFRVSEIDTDLQNFAENILSKVR